MQTLSGMMAEAGDWRHELFARGYVIAEEVPVCPDGWTETAFDHLKIACHPGLETRMARSGGAAILCLGIIFDALRPRVEAQDYLQELATHLAGSEQAMLAALAASNGRYVLLYRTPDGHPHLVADATGMRTALCHFGERVTISSHINLLGAGAAAGEERDAREFRFGFPGRMTPIRNVFVLTPNTRLDLARRRIERFWPVGPVAPRSLDEAARFIEARLAGSYDWIAARYDHFLTLTAGLDSRVTLSVVKQRGRYATYHRKDGVDTDAVDRDTARDIARRTGIDHRILGADSRADIPDGFRAAVRLNTIMSHIPGMAFAYRTRMLETPGQGVHIRSNLSEIGRMFYQGRNGGQPPELAEDLMTLWSANPLLWNARNAASFSDYAEATGFFEAPVELSSLFYWEHRMGTWHSQVALESDIACETLSLYNCRALLEAMWSVPEEFQRRSLLMKRIIWRQWPELTEFPLNGQPFAPSKQAHRDAVTEG